MSVKAAVRELAALVLPARCLGCDARIILDEEWKGLCPSCRTRLRPPGHPRCVRCHFPMGTGRARGSDCLSCRDWPAVIERARYAVVLRPPADALVHALKYGGWAELAPFMAGRMVAAVADDDSRWAECVVVPIPTTARRRRSRGYNQAHLLGEALASARGWPLIDALERLDVAKTQHTLFSAVFREPQLVPASLH